MPQVSIPGIHITNRVSATVQFTSHMIDYGNSAFLSPQRVTFTAETNQGGDLEELRTQLEDAASKFNGAFVVGVNNSMLFQYLDPKQGDTIQTYYAKIKEEVQRREVDGAGIGYASIGGPSIVPSITKSGVLVFVTAQEPTLEYLSAIVLCDVPWANLIRASTDTGISATVAWQSQANLL